MNQLELNRDVARATGESLSTIDERGFVPLTAIPFELERTIDWDAVDEERVALFGGAW
jgi:hypothetical protein